MSKKRVFNKELNVKSKALKGDVRHIVHQDAINAQSRTFVDRKKEHQKGKIKHKNKGYLGSLYWF